MNQNLRERLSALARQARPAGAGGPARAPAPAGTSRRRRGTPPPLDRILPGREFETGHGRCWLHERPLEQWAGAAAGLAAGLAHRLAGPLPADLDSDPGGQAWRDRGLDAALFLDLETTGLSATPIFLAGLLSAEGGRMAFRLYLARNYAEEPALVAALSAEVARRPIVVTFNGKSYDLPFLRERVGRLRLPALQPVAVLDMLHPSRRRWAGRLPDCRLQTLEWHLCGRRRAGDINGSDIPDAYHRFVRDQDPRPLLPVFQHNILDLQTLAEITQHVLGTPPSPEED